MTFLLPLLLACNPDTPKPDSEATVVADQDKDGYTVEEGDCNDADASIHGAATEICDGVDNNCDGAVDEGTTSLYYTDSDGDGYGDPATGAPACEAETGQVSIALDCDDADNATYPGAPESCTEAVDRNCDGATGRTDADGDGFAACEECDDRNPSVNPGATESCDPANIDEDCNGLADDADPAVDPASQTASYLDLDADGYGAQQLVSCDEIGTDQGGDCDDADSDFYPGAPESCTDTLDYNCDGSTGYADADGDRYAACEDCDDQNAGVHPGATELCDGLDNDCDGQVDPATSVDAGTWYADGDADGYGDPAAAVDACTAPAGYQANSDDCDDADSAVNPGATELCDGLDNDCDGQVDPASSVDAATWYADIDADGYGDPAAAVDACAAPAGYQANSDDCDDADNAVHPGATELCDGIDNNCDGQVDPASSVDAATWYADSDADGYGDPAAAVDACTAPAGTLANSDDCDDADGAVHPGATEVCDGIDNDCDGQVDPASSVDAATWYADRDADGYGDPAAAVDACAAPAGYQANSDDCDDADSAVRPGAAEVCDGIDNDCDGQVDPASSVDAATWYADRDADGYGDPAAAVDACTAPAGYQANSDDCDDADSAVHPGATELCDGIDNDCDGQVDPASSVDAAIWYSDRDADGYGDPASSTRACTQPAGYGTDTSDCNDQDATIHPGAGCDYVSTFYSPGNSLVWVASETGASVNFSGCGGSAAVAVVAGGVSATQSVGTRTCTLRSADPFLSMITYNSAGGDQVMKARGLDGALLSTELVLWSGDYITVMNPAASSTSFTVEQWNGTTWTAYSSGTVAAGQGGSVTAAWGVYRVRATQPVTAYGMVLDNIENYLEYLPATDGFLAGEDYIFSFPAELGQVALTGTCIDAAGCSITLSTASGTVASRSIAQGASWYDYVVPATNYRVQSVGTVLLRHEATPYGFGASDGTSMDADLVPGTSGVEYDTNFLFTAAEGTGNGYTSRRSDVVLLGYRDGTRVTVEQWSGTAWSTITSTTISAGSASTVASNLTAARLIRISASTPIQVELTHTTSEYAWSMYSDHYAD